MRLALGGLKLLGDVQPGLAARIANDLWTRPRRHDRPTREQEVLATASPRPIPFGTGALAGWRWGEASCPTILLVHGWEGRGAQLGSFVAPLLERGFSVVTYDAPGHGDSPGSRANVVLFADAVAAALAVLGPVHAVIAHSMGAASTTWALRSRPSVGRLAYISPSDPQRWGTRFFDALGAGRPLREHMARGLEARYGIDPAALSTVALAEDMSGPLLIVHDEDDTDVPVTTGRDIAANWEGARFETTSGLGHRRILRAREVVASVVDWVAG